MKDSLTLFIRQNIYLHTLKKFKISHKKMKQSSITFKTTPEIKKALETLSKQGFRSLSAQVEMIVVKYLKAKGIDWIKEDKK